MSDGDSLGGSTSLQWLDRSYGEDVFRISEFFASGCPLPARHFAWHSIISTFPILDPSLKRLDQSMRLVQIRHTATLLLFAALVACEMQSQTTTSGALAGTVVDQTNAAVSDAVVTIRDNAKGTIQSTRTNEEGVCRLLFLAPGNYTLSVAHAGFQEHNQVATVLLGPAVSVNVTLAIAKARTDITVRGEGALIHAENGDSSATMNQTQIHELPNPGNDLTYVVQTAPGVVMNTDVQGLANFSILGMPGFSYLHTMDGMNDNDNGYNLSQVGALILLLGQNQIQEATVVSTGYSGQFGGAAGITPRPPQTPAASF